MNKLQDGHVPDYLVQLIREAGEVARSYRPHNTGRWIKSEKQQENDEIPK